MGNYVYKIKPSNSIEVEGLGETITVHCAEYAYKPYWLGGYWNGKRYVDPDEMNRKMHFQSGAQACDNAWKRRGDRPTYVTLEDHQSIRKAYPLEGGTYRGYGSGADVYFYDERANAGHFNDGGKIGWHVGWIYWSEYEQRFILQYRQLDALEDDPRHAA